MSLCNNAETKDGPRAQIRPRNNDNKNDTDQAEESAALRSPCGSELDVLGTHSRGAHWALTRPLPQVLDAPALQDDFYLNVVDWSAQNILAVGLGMCVYLWSACTSKVSAHARTHAHLGGVGMYAPLWGVHVLADPQPPGACA